MSPVLQARALCKVYGSGDAAVHALRDVDLDVARGEFLVLLGASGSGKSTLLNILGGLDVPTSGELRFQGRALTGTGDRALTAYRREHVGFVFQFYNLIPSLTARENVALVTDIAPGPMRAEEALALVGLAARLDQPDAGGAGAGAGRTDAAPQPLPVAALRRRAAAGGDRPGHRQAAGSATVR